MATHEGPVSIEQNKFSFLGEEKLFLILKTRKNLLVNRTLNNLTDYLCKILRLTMMKDKYHWDISEDKPS